jgi:hypothetical protein
LRNLLYTQLITTYKVHALLAPVAYNCETRALIAENAGIPFINGADYTLPILMDAPGSGYTNLQYTRNLNANYWTSAAAVVTVCSRCSNLYGLLLAFFALQFYTDCA